MLGLILVYLLINTSNNYTYNYSVGTGIYTISGLCRLVSDWLIAIAVNNYSVQSFSLAIQAKSGTVTINYNQNNFTLPQDLSNYIMNLLTNQFTPYLYTDLYNIKFYPYSTELSIYANLTIFNKMLIINSNYYYSVPLTPTYTIQNLIGTPGIPNGTYNYIYCYYSYNNTNNNKNYYYESEPSQPVTVSINSNIANYSQSVLLNLTASPYVALDSNHGINIYRTKANGSVYYYLDTTTNTNYTDTKLDTSLISQYVQSKFELIPSYNPPYNFSNNNTQFDFSFMPISSFGLNNLYPSLGYYVGFREEIYTANYNTPVYTEQPLNMCPNKYVFLSINNWGFINLMNNKVLAKILISNQNANIVNEFSSKKYDLVQPQDIYDLNIQLLDYLGNPINFGGKDWSMSLSLLQIKHTRLGKPNY